MKNFRTFDLAVDFYHASKTIKLDGVLKEQLNRAASSVALNLAEGRGRPTIKDQLRFFSIALGSARECQAVLKLALLDNHPLFKQLDTLAASLFCLVRQAKLEANG